MHHFPNIYFQVRFSLPARAVAAVYKLPKTTENAGLKILSFKQIYFKELFISCMRAAKTITSNNLLNW